MANKILIGVSLFVHGALAVLIGRIEVKESRAATAIEIAETKKKAVKPAPKTEIQPEPPPKERAVRRVAAKAAAEPLPEPTPVAKAQAAMAELPEFGLTLSGGSLGGGVAVPHGVAGGSQANTPKPAAAAPVKRALSAAPAAPLDECTDPPAKPKPVNVPQPAYTDQARAAGVEGKVRVELTVDETGRVVSVRLISGLGHGLDEAALAAAQRASFQPAVRCGKPTRATFTISMRFAAS